MLIHEATFDDSMAQMAADKRHSTVTQAINSGKSMDARIIVLSHFSARYPVIDMDISDVSERLVLAHDGLTLSLNPSRPLPSVDVMLPVMEKLLHRSRHEDDTVNYSLIP